MSAPTIEQIAALPCGFRQYYTEQSRIYQDGFRMRRESAQARAYEDAMRWLSKKTVVCGDCIGDEGWILASERLPDADGPKGWFICDGITVEVTTQDPSWWNGDFPPRVGAKKVILWMNIPLPTKPEAG